MKKSQLGVVTPPWRVDASFPRKEEGAVEVGIQKDEDILVAIGERAPFWNPETLKSLTNATIPSPELLQENSEMIMKNWVGIKHCR